MIQQTYTNEVSWNSQPVALRPEVAVVALLGKTLGHKLKLFTVVQDGDLWRWRVSWPEVPGKCGMVSTMSYPTSADAERAAQNIAHLERPSICMLNAFENVPVDAGQPAEMREDWVGM